MKQPPLEDMLARTDSRYTLAVAIAKRAREIVDGSKPRVEVDSDKPVSIAMAEIVAGKIKYERTKEGIK